MDVECEQVNQNGEDMISYPKLDRITKNEKIFKNC